MKIERLKIDTPNLMGQIRFYREVLGLQISKETEKSFEVKLGFSLLQFQQLPQATPYHIAFHIPSRQEESAVAWLKERTKILQDEGRDLVDFPNWNARSVYFYDADNNILEFISRSHCYPPTSQVFTVESILGISEIGLATTEVQQAFQFLNRHYNLQKFTEFGTSFCATGDDEGLFIVIDKNQKDWFPSSDKAYASGFEIHFTAQGLNGSLTYKNERLELL